MSIMLFLAAVAGAASPTPAKAAAFEFRDWRVHDQHRADDPRLQRCVTIPAGTACAFTDNRIAGVAARQIGAAFGRDGLFALEAKFAASDAAVVEAALRDRYGAPCESRTEHPRQLMTGDKLARLVRVWCFADGRATFMSMTDRRSEASFEFATRDAPRQAAVRDF